VKTARRCLGLCLVVCAAAASSASAQSRFEIGAGMSWTGGFAAGGLDATEARNPTAGSTPLTLFGTSPRLDSVAGAMGSAAFYLSKNLAVEAAAEYARPVLRTPIAADFEGATGPSVESRLRTFTAGGSLLYHFGAARLTPFVAAGGGWIRQLDEENVMLVTGPEAHAGGGVRYRVDRHFAVRGEVGATARERSIAFEEKRRVLPRVAVRLTYRW
jgi:hypothetical protein